MRFPSPVKRFTNAPASAYDAPCPPCPEAPIEARYRSIVQGRFCGLHRRVNGTENGPIQIVTLMSLSLAAWPPGSLEGGMKPHHHRCASLTMSPQNSIRPRSLLHRNPRWDIMLPYCSVPFLSALFRCRRLGYWARQKGLREWSKRLTRHSCHINDSLGGGGISAFKQI